MNKQLPYSKINTILLVLLLALSLGVLYVTLQNNRDEAAYTLLNNPSEPLPGDMGGAMGPMGHTQTRDNANGPDYQPGRTTTPSASSATGIHLQ